MNSPTDKREPFDVLLDAYLEELMAMSDADVMDTDNPAELKATGMQMLEAAKAEAGKWRLAAAKAQLAAGRKTVSTDDEPAVSVAAAREFLRKASNDPRFTLAARGLDEMSDDDALRLYRQYKRLERERNDPGEDGA